MDINTIPHISNEINEDVSSILRAARAELLYPGQNATPVKELADQLNALADGIELSKVMDDLETAHLIDHYFKTYSNVLANTHPSPLVRALAIQLLKLRKDVL